MLASAWRTVGIASFVGALLLLGGCPASSPSDDAGRSGDPRDAGSDGGAPACRGDDLAELGSCVDEARLLEDLEYVAEPRIPGSSHWRAVQDLCAERLTALGFDVELHSYGPDGETGINVVGTLPGSSKAEEAVLVAAHYDSVDSCPGADDNASGVAGVLEVARLLSRGSWERSLMVACWDEEELGLVGSSAFVDDLAGRPVQPVQVLTFEMIGFSSEEPQSQEIPFGFGLLFPDAVAAVEANERRGDFIAVVADEASRPAVAAFTDGAEGLGLPAVHLEAADGVKTSSILADLQRSDHYPFWEIDVPAIMLTDTAEFRNVRYHCTEGSDEVSVLDVHFAGRVVGATVLAAGALLSAD